MPAQCLCIQLAHRIIGGKLVAMLKQEITQGLGLIRGKNTIQDRNKLGIPRKGCVQAQTKPGKFGLRGSLHPQHDNSARYTALHFA